MRHRDGLLPGIPSLARPLLTERPILPRRFCQSSRRPLGRCPNAVFARCIQRAESLPPKPSHSESLPIRASRTAGFSPPAAMRHAARDEPPSHRTRVLAARLDLLQNRRSPQENPFAPLSPRKRAAFRAPLRAQGGGTNRRFPSRFQHYKRLIRPRRTSRIDEPFPQAARLHNFPETYGPRFHVKGNRPERSSE